MVLARLGAAVALGALLLLPSPAGASGSDVTVVATVDGHSLKAAGANDPLPLHPNDNTVIDVSVTNNGSTPVDIRSVRLDGRVLGLAFFSYTTRVDLTVPPGATGHRTFALDLTDLKGQATGLLPSSLSLLAPDRSVVYVEHGSVDVKGSITSVYGIFGLAVAALTALLLAGLILRLVRRTLPSSRWVRAARFAVPGLGLGLVVTFTLGVLHVLVPSTGTSLALLAGGLLVGLVLGYLSPTASDEADRDELDERDIITPPPPPPAAAPPPQPQLTEPDDPRQTRVVGPPPPPPAS